MKILGCKKIKIFLPFYSELSDIVNSSFNLGEPILDFKVVRKISRSLPKIFSPKVIAIEKNKDIDLMRIDEIIGFIQTYEMTLPNSQKPKDFTFKASKNEEKDIKMPYNITRDELKKFMKQTRKFNKNQESGKGKRLDKSSKENDRSNSKGRKIECLTVVV